MDGNLGGWVRSRVVKNECTGGAGRRFCCSGLRGYIRVSGCSRWTSRFTSSICSIRECVSFKARALVRIRARVLLRVGARALVSVRARALISVLVRSHFPTSMHRIGAG